MVRTQVLVVEDDESMVEFYSHFFDTAHRDEFIWHHARNARSALQILERVPLDVVVLDWRLPDRPGLDVLRSIRSNRHTKQLLVFVVTGEGEWPRCVAALEAGADDLLGKPFEEAMLLARLHCLLRRREMVETEAAVYRADGLHLDLDADQCSIDGKAIPLYPKERDLLKVFLRRPNMLHQPSDLWDLVWGYQSKKWEHTLVQTIAALRRKLGSKWGQRLESHRGRGYIFLTQSLV